VKLLDFGVSKVSTERPERLTEQGMLLGTAEYMAPEQANGEEVDARTDLYAFGVLAYELVTGTLPFSARGTLNLLLKHLNEAPEPPSRRAAGLPPALEELILHALSKRREDRPQTMAEVSASLRAVREALPAATPGEPLPALARTLLSASRRDAAAEPDDLPRNLRSRAPLWLLLGGATLAAAGAWVLWPAARTPAPAPVVAAPPQPAGTASPAPAPHVTLRSSPPGASVYRGDQLLGTTPLALDSPAGELRVVLDGYQPELVQLPAGQDSAEVTLTRAPPPPRTAPARHKAGPYHKVEDLKPSPY
jgi:serine/threonine-protein kinase